MVIEYSLHSLSKIEILKSHGINISKELIENTIKFPDKVETGYNGRLIAQKIIDDFHVIRVVYENKENNNNCYCDNGLSRQEVKI